MFKYLHHEVGKWSILYSGPRDNFQVVLPAGTFDVTAEIHDDRGAFTKAPVVSNFRSFLPSEKMYEAFDMNGAIEHADTIGDAATKSQLMAADVSRLLNLSKTPGLRDLLAVFHQERCLLHETRLQAETDATDPRLEHD